MEQLPHLHSVTVSVSVTMSVSGVKGASQGKELCIPVWRQEGNWVPGQGSLVVADRAESKTHQSCLSCRAMGDIGGRWKQPKECCWFSIDK